MKYTIQLNVVKFILIIGIFISNFQIFSQTNYSEEALTGRGKSSFVGNDIKLQNEVFEAFENMRKDAFKEGVLIEIVSAYRSFNRQMEIWNSKYESYILEGLSEQESIEKIIEYSTIPGTSRHHWGTDIDIIEGGIDEPKHMLTKENYNSGGIYSNLKNWMDSNSEKYGFYLVYDNNPDRKGFKYEPWHYSFKKIAKPMLKEYLEIDLVEIFQKSNIKGSHLFSEIFLKKYFSEQILDISLSLK